MTISLVVQFALVLYQPAHHNVMVNVYVNLYSAVATKSLTCGLR